MQSFHPEERPWASCCWLWWLPFCPVGPERPLPSSPLTDRWSAAQQKNNKAALPEIHQQIQSDPLASFSAQFSEIRYVKNTILQTARSHTDDLSQDKQRNSLLQMYKDIRHTSPRMSIVVMHRRGTAKDENNFIPVCCMPVYINILYVAILFYCL